MMSLGALRDTYEKEGILLKDGLGELASETATSVTFDSREAAPGALFFCKGAHFKEEFLKSAMEGGAIAYVSEQEYAFSESNSGPAPCLIVSDIRRAMALAGNLFYEEAWRKLMLVGITGTKGKSTTAYFVKSILDHHLAKAMRPESAILSSIDNYDGVIREESHLTTPEALVLHRRFHNAVEKGISHLTMEVSSHALKYDRTYGVIFDIGAFLNMGEDHISPAEHDSVEDYVNSKMKIFEQCRFAVINLDQTHWERALNEAIASRVVERIFTFSIGSMDRHEGAKILLETTKKPHAHFMAYQVEAGKTDLSFRATGGGRDEEYKIMLPGSFNVENALCAVAIATILDIPTEAIREGLLATRVGGRMEVFTDKSQQKIVIVDYAHNAMSYNALFDAVEKDYAGRPVYAIFSCPGGKAFDRRQILGEIAGKRADMCILTEEDAGEESIVAINEEIGGYVEGVGGRYEIIPDREEAIRHSIFDTEENAVILALAKGRETRQKRGIEYEEVTSDVDLVERFLKEYDGEGK